MTSRPWKQPTVTLELETGAAFEILDSLRLGPIYVLKDHDATLLGEDFNPYKWDGYEVEFADQLKKCHDDFGAAMKKALGNED